MVTQDPGDVNLGWQGCPTCHDFHIFLSWCTPCGAFHSCLAEPSGAIACGLRNVCVAVVVQVIGGKSHSPGDGCTEHIGWSSSVQVKDFAK